MVFVGVATVVTRQVGMDFGQNNKTLKKRSEVLTSLLFLTFSKINHVKK